MKTLLVLLPGGDAPARALAIDAGGAILARPALPLAAPPSPRNATRTVVVVPGAAVSVFWLELPARSALQARAAARILLQDRIAAAVDTLHVAVVEGDAPGVWMVAAVARETMQTWLAQCDALGLQPDALVPEHLLLPAQDALVVAPASDGTIAVRGRRLAFCAEPALAARICGEDPLPPVLDREGADALLAGNAQTPALDLLQDGFARRRKPGQASSRRRLALLAAALLASFVLLPAAQALRDGIDARRFDARADALARQHVAVAADADAVAALEHRFRAQVQPKALADAAAALSAAVAALPAARLDSLEYGLEGGLQAGLLHEDAGAPDALADALAGHGLTLEVVDAQPVERQTRSQLRIEGAAR